MDDIFTQCREGNAVAVRLWLDNTENDLNQGDDHGFSPLHWACREGRSAVVEMLIMRGARINVMNRGDDTPCTWLPAMDTVILYRSCCSTKLTSMQ